jgi:hypothetical protein
VKEQAVTNPIHKRRTAAQERASQRATLIEKIYVERGFEGTLRWIQERRGQKLSRDLETVTRDMHLNYLHRINEDFKQSAAWQKRETAREAERARMKAWFVPDPDTRSPEEIAAARAHARALNEAAMRTLREQAAELQEQLQIGKEIVAAGYKTLAKKHHPDAGGSKIKCRN